MPRLLNSSELGSAKLIITESDLLNQLRFFVCLFTLCKKKEKTKPNEKNETKDFV